MTVLIAERRFTPQGAVHFAGHLVKDTVANFRANEAALPALGDGAGGDAADGLAGGAAAAAAAGLDAVLFEVGPVGVAGARIEIGLRVVPGALVFILDKKTNRSAESDAVLDARLKLNKIFLIALSKR